MIVAFCFLHFAVYVEELVQQHTRILPHRSERCRVFLLFCLPLLSDTQYGLPTSSANQATKFRHPGLLVLCGVEESPV